jgi:predicted double-glycine peptidase
MEVLVNQRPGIGRLAAFVLYLAMVVVPRVARADEEDHLTSIDCGPSALYNLSRLVGQPIGLEQIRSHLPTDRRGNFSMEELSRSALACGLRLRGVLLAKNEGRAIDRPMLVFLNRGEHGHFLVVRPLGTSGKLVQVVDSANPPRVMDKSALLAAKSWTGLALIRDDSSPWVVGGRVAACCTLAIGILIFLVRRARTSKWLTRRNPRPQLAGSD